MKQNSNLCTIILNWNGFQDTIECINSMQKSVYPHEMVVVDNGSTNDSVSKIKESFPELTVIETGVNLGYAGGNNVGMRHALSLGAEYVLVINNDVIIDKSMIAKLVEALEQDEKLGAVSPSMYFYTDKDALWWSGSKLDLTNGRIINLGYGQPADELLKKDRYSDYLCGCAILFRAKALEECGLFLEDYFHTGEDVDLSLRLRQADWKLKVIPGAKLWHKVSRSGQGDLSPFYIYYLERNRLWLMKRFGYWHGTVSYLRLLPLYLKRFAAMLIKARNFKSMMSIVRAIKDFNSGKLGATY